MYREKSYHFKNGYNIKRCQKGSGFSNIDPVYFIRVIFIQPRSFENCNNNVRNKTVLRTSTDYVRQVNFY